MHCKHLGYFTAALALWVQTASGQLPQKGEATTTPPAAKALVQFLGDSVPGVLSDDLLAALAFDHSLLAKALAKIAPEAAKRAADFPEVVVQSMPNVPGAPRAYVAVRSDYGVPADKLLTAWLGCLQDWLREADVDHRADEERAAQLKEQVLSLARELEEQRRAYDTLAKLHKVPKSAEIAVQKETQLALERQSMAVELHGLRARQKGLEEHLAIMAQRVHEEAANDPVVRELEKALEIEKELAAARQTEAKRDKTKSVEETARQRARSFLEAQAELARHQAELSKFRREAAQGAGGARLGDLRNRLEDTAIQIAETEAKLEVLDGVAGGLGSNAQVEQKRLEIESLERDYRAMAEELSKTKRRLRSYRPIQVRVLLNLESSDEPTPKVPAAEKASPQDKPAPGNPPKEAAPAPK